MRDGWQFIFLTGRTFAFSWPILKTFKTPYFLACQNGAHLLEMPSLKTLTTHYLDSSLLPALEILFTNAKLPLVIESGYSNGDKTYYRPQDFNTEQLDAYLKLRISLSSDEWIAIQSFSELAIQGFGTGKYFSKENEIQQLPFNTCTLRDPFRPGYVLTHINHEKATKDNILKEFCQKFPDLPLITGGDDHNDYEMLKLGNVKIVSDHAPQKLKDIADIITPAAEGMITAIKEGISRL